MGRLPAPSSAREVLIDPTQPKRVYAVGEAALYRSDDAGQTWQSAAQGLPDGGLSALALDPRQPLRLYAATADGSIYLSEDGANTWRPAAGTGGGG